MSPGEPKPAHPTGRRPSDLATEWPRRGQAAGSPEWPREFARSAEDRSALLILLGLAALTPRRLLELASKERTATACLAAVMAGRAGSDGDRAAAARTDPAEVAARVAACGARLVAVGDEKYPAQLLDLYDPPAGLFVIGESLLGDGRPCVSMVGARNCSTTGRDIAKAIGAALSRAGVCVVSGAARGIDIASHEGALRGGGATAAVLGCGIDVAYPPSHRRLLTDIAAAGGVLSEYPPGVPAEPFRFPARNRIVAGLSRAVVIVEGAKGSGSMITADHALEIGREVFAVPGPVNSPLAAVPLSLIRQGATMIRDAVDLLQDLGLESLDVAPPDPAAGLAPDARRVWDALTGPSLPDQVASMAGLALSEATPLLVSLELRGMVRQVGGRYERRIPELHRD